MSAEQVLTPTTAVPEARLKGRSRGRVWHSLLREKLALAGAIYLVLLVIGAVFAPVLISQSPTQIDILVRFQPPAWLPDGTWAHPLGTDGLGRDILARLLYGARVSLIVGVSVVVLAGLLGTVLGLLAGYKGGVWETVVMRIADAQLAFPGLLLILMVLAFVGQSLAIIVAILSLYGWMIYARLVRGMVLQLRETPAIQAAQLVGCSTPRILFRHLLPNLSSAVMTQAMVEFARVILAEASLSYLGLGVQPPDASLGLMVAENQGNVGDAWWTVVFPGALLALTVLAINVVANWLRVETDPQQRQRKSSIKVQRRRRGRKSALDAKVQQAAPVEPLANQLLVVEHLQVGFDTLDGHVAAVRDASFSVRAGETVGIVGESGSGKSTAALALLGIVPPPGRVTGGRILWNGHELGSREQQELKGSEITMIFQDPMTSLNPLVPVGRQIGEVLVKHKGMSKAAARKRAEELLEVVGVPSPRRRLDQLPHELSGGLRQRVMIASALAPEPKLVIADEPTTALDATIQAQILELIADLQQRTGIAMLLITHDLGVVARVCQRVVVMYGGRVVERGPVDELFAHPRHRYTNALLATAPQIDSGSERLPTIPGHPPRPHEAILGCPFAPRCEARTDQCDEMPPDASAGPERSFACWHPVESRAARELV
jgi:peptide/nickel transport system permease protein